MPDTVVLPEQLHHFHSSQGSLEFPLYHFLFVQRGLERKRKFNVVGSDWQCQGIENLLRVTVVGPDEEEMIRAGTPKDIAAELYQETSYWALKNPDSNQPFKIGEMVNFHTLEIGERIKVYEQLQKVPEVWLERSGPESYRVFHGEIPYEVDLSVETEQIPNYKGRHQALDPGAGVFKLAVLGRSNGFDPADPANGYLLNIDGSLVLWDCPAYLHWQLKHFKVDPLNISALVLSHVHEDHIDTSESLRDPPFELYTTPEVYYSLLVKLSASFNCTLEEAKKFHHWHPLETGKALEIAGASWQFFHSVHAIPALGARISKNIGGKSALLHISGDHLSDATLKSMLANGGLSQKRYDEVSNILTGTESYVLVDVGGGLIHGDFHDHLHRGQRIGFMHTGLIQEDLPQGMELVSSGQVIDILKD